MEQAILITQLEENSNIIGQHLITFEEFFSNKEAIILNEKQLSLFYHGVLLICQKSDGIYRIYDSNHQFIGCGVCKANKLKRDIVIL